MSWLRRPSRRVMLRASCPVTPFAANRWLYTRSSVLSEGIVCRSAVTGARIHLRFWMEAVYIVSFGRRMEE